MSAGVQRREIARRVFAAEFDLADESIRVGAGERAPTYVISPGGAWMNRVFSVGVLTEQTQVSAGEMIRARIADPSGAIVTYAGQYQPAAAARLEQATVGSMLALTGKARTYQPDDGDAVYTSVRPETVTEVDAQTQGQWIVDTAMATLRRVDLMAALMAASHPTVELQALADADGIDDQVLGGVAAIQRYSPGLGFLEQLRVLALEALEVVSGDRDAISDVSLTVGAEASTLGADPRPRPICGRCGGGARDDRGGRRWRAALPCHRRGSRPRRWHQPRARGWPAHHGCRDRSGGVHPCAVSH
jgi:Uncharacterized protein conserved in archaea